MPFREVRVISTTLKLPLSAPCLVESFADAGAPFVTKQETEKLRVALGKCVAAKKRTSAMKVFDFFSSSTCV